MSLSSEERASELRKIFFESAQELVQALNEYGLKLEQHPADTELIRDIRRTVHTLKGDSAACGFKELSQLAHELKMPWHRTSPLALAHLSPKWFSAPPIFLTPCWRPYRPTNQRRMAHRCGN